MIQRTRHHLLPILAAALLAGGTLAQGVVTAGPAAAASTSAFGITPAPSSSVFGQSVTFTATITGPSGRPTGTVDFLDGATQLCGGVTLGGGGSVGVAACTTSSLSVGGHAISATYSGDGTYDPETSTTFQPALAHAVSAADTSTAVDGDPNPSVFSGPVGLTATVSPVAPGAGTPTGTVTFQSGGVDIVGCTTRPMTGGNASCSTSALTVGPHPITAIYAGDGNFDTSTSTPASQTVAKADTTTTVDGAPNPSTHAQDVTYTATISAVTPATATPGSGTVDFKSDGVPITGCQDVTVATGSAGCTTGLSPTGAPQITAEYSGDGSFNASVSPPFFQAVNQASTSTALGSAPNPAVFSQAVVFTATVSSTAGSPTGTVAFKAGGSNITGCATRPIASGEATCTTSTLPVANTSITAVYAGDVNFATSTSTPLGQVVAKADTTVAVGSSDNTSSWNESVTFTATITPTSPATAAPNSGTVGFTADGSSIAGCTARPITAGTATCSTATLPVGTRLVAASYAGDASYNGDDSADFTQTVSAASTSTALLSGTNPSVVSGPVAFTATVTSTAGTPTGTVAFKAGVTTITGCGTRPLAGGSATCSTSALPLGDSSITAVYGTDANFAASTSTPVVQTVGKAATTSAIGSNDATTAWHESVTFTATISPVTPATVAPNGGTVSFNVGGAAIAGCATRAVATGTATCSTSDLPVGASSVTAVFSGDTSYLTSTSSAMTHTVSPATTVTSLTSDEPNSRYGQSVTFTATVTSTAGTPTGSVSFYAVERDATRTLLATKTLSAGTASTSTSLLPVRTDSPIVAEYAGATIFASSTGTFDQTVNRSLSRTLMTSSANPSKFGQVVTLSVEVRPMVPGGGQPSGKVAFFRVTDGHRTSIGTARLVDGKTSLQTSGTPVGVHTMIAEYAGGVNHRPSSRSNQQRVKQ